MSGMPEEINGCGEELHDVNSVRGAEDDVRGRKMRKNV